MCAKPTSITIYLPDGTPDGLRIVEQTLWTGIGNMVSRQQYPSVFGPGRIFPPGGLTYWSDQTLTRRLARNLYRANGCFAPATGWRSMESKRNSGLISSFSRTRIPTSITRTYRHIESRLIGLGQKAKRARIENGNQPVAPQMSEIDRATAEQFLESMLIVYPLLGVDAFESTASFVVTPPLVPTLEFAITAKGLNGRGRLVPEGFLVLAGTESPFESAVSFTGGYSILRENLIKNGVLVPKGSRFVFAQDYAFASPSAAAGVVLGRQANAPKCGKRQTGAR